MVVVRVLAAAVLGMWVLLAVQLFAAVWMAVAAVAPLSLFVRRLCLGYLLARLYRLAEYWLILAVL